MKEKQPFEKNTKVLPITIAAILVLVVVLIMGTWWTGRNAERSTQEAVRSVSLLYLNELAGRREQVIATTLKNNIRDVWTGVDTITEEDLSDKEHLEAFQKRLKKLYNLERFAFVDTNGLIYTSTGTQKNIDEYAFDYKSLSAPDISIHSLEKGVKKIVIAIPLKRVYFNGKRLSVCFMEMDMNTMLQGISLEPNTKGTTFCNLYTTDGTALTNVVLGGLASEDNLLSAMNQADYEDSYSYERFSSDFRNAREGFVSFTYHGIQETLYYVPVDGTDWVLTYLIRESVITDQIGSVTRNMVRRSLLQTALTALVLFLMFWIIIMQLRRTSRLVLEQETSEAANKAKQEELEQRLVLQEQLLEQEKKRAQQDSMITALASDYRSVYFVDLDTDKGICFRADGDWPGSLAEGQDFHYLETFRQYAEKYVDESYREEFLQFIQPENIRSHLRESSVITLRYLLHKSDKDYYEMLRMADVNEEDSKDHVVKAVGVSFSDVDSETRESMAKNQVLSEALTAAEDANRAKTAFLSNMSHEIRTPMNAIIGLDSIALNDPTLSDATRGHLEKIGSSAQHLLTLINDILDMSRIESGRMVLRNEEFSLSQLLEQINTLVSGQCNDKGLHFNCHINGDIDEFFIGDEMKIRQIIINILSNAVKFTPEGGNVDFTVERTAHFEHRSTLRFTIRDTGIGMEESFLDRIFDSFSQEDSSATNKYGSSGLGMAITKSLVDMMNGTIDVQSKKGAGTTFTVTLTLMDAEKSGFEEEIAELRPKEMKVLIVDDDPVACEHAKLVLEKVGIASDTVLSGEEAISLVQLHHARRDPYNLILVDWKMPGLDGVETTREIRSIVGHESAIIILTAYRWDEILEEATEAGVDSFLSKPLFASNIMEEFQRALKRKTAAVKESKPETDLTGCRILLAEDVPINAEIIVMVLSMREIQVDHAENGKIAVDMFKDHPENYYDAILMDMRMPEMDGLTATKTIRALDRPDAASIPIIALTANAFDEDVQRSLQAGLNAHLSKPVEPDNLFATLEELIDR